MGDFRATPEGNRPAGAANLQVRGQEKAKELADKVEKPVDWTNRRKIFTLFLLMNLLLNYDTGVIPASLMQVKHEIRMSFQEQGALGSLVYLGLCIASIIVSTVYQQFSAARTMIWMLCLNAAFCLMFSLSYNLYLMYVARIGMGFTQAFCVIYGPVWTNEFSPPESATRWMGLLQSFVPLGIMLGYTCTGLIVNFAPYTTWRAAIQLQALFEIPVAYALSKFDPEDIDIINVGVEHVANSDSKFVRIDTINISQLANFWNQVAILFSNGIFVTVTLALCLFYFVVTGIQYWITVYLIEVLGSDPIQVLVSFSVTCISGPLVGVAVGSYIADHMGGYKGRNLVNAIKLCVLCSLLACFFAVPIGYSLRSYVGSLFYVVPLLWMLLFFGGAMSPTATGITVNAVGREHQSASSSFSQLIYNLGGYFMAPVLSAFVMDQFPDPVIGLQWGFRMVLGVSVGGMIFLLVSWCVASYRLRKSGYLDFEEEGDQVGDLKEYQVGELALEVIRRRAHSHSF